MLSKKYLSAALLLLCGTVLHAQRDLLAYRSALQRFKEHGAMVISPDTQMIEILKREITFGEIIGKTEADPTRFKGLFIVEYSNRPNYSYGNMYGHKTAYTGFFLAVNEAYIKPYEQPKKLGKSLFLAALRVPNETREKLPMYAAVLDGLIRLTYEQDKDLSVLPKDGENGVNLALGNKPAEIKNKELLIMEYEAAQTIRDPEAVARQYPYPYRILDFTDVVRAFDERTPGKAVMVTTMLENYVGKYILDCETHELLYGRQHISRSRYVHDRDLGVVYAAIRRAE